MNVRELISFYHVARLSSISKAANFLDLGQPTVTLHLQKMEREFGVTLFDRIKRPIQLTSDGVAFYDLVKPMVENLAESMEALKSQMEYPEHRGSFVIGAYPDLVLHRLPDIVRSFRDRYPSVQIKLVATSYTDILDRVSAGDLDLALVNRPESQVPSLEFNHLFSSQFVLVTPLGHELLDLPKITLPDIARWPLVLLGPKSYTRRILERALREADLSYNIPIEIDIMEMAKRYVEVGLGISVTNEYMVQPEDDSRIGIRRLAGLLPTTDIGLITLKGKFLSRSVRNFMDELVLKLDERTDGR